MNIGAYVAVFVGAFIAIYFGYKAAKQKNNNKK